MMPIPLLRQVKKQCNNNYNLNYTNIQSGAIASWNCQTTQNSQLKTHIKPDNKKSPEKATPSSKHFCQRDQVCIITCAILRRPDNTHKLCVMCDCFKLCNVYAESLYETCCLKARFALALPSQNSQWLCADFLSNCCKSCIEWTVYTPYVNVTVLL
jgi:hypothetical protein